MQWLPYIDGRNKNSADGRMLRDAGIWFRILLTWEMFKLNISETYYYLIADDDGHFDQDD